MLLVCRDCGKQHMLGSGLKEAGYVRRMIAEGKLNADLVSRPSNWIKKRGRKHLTLEMPKAEAPKAKPKKSGFVKLGKIKPAYIDSKLYSMNINDLAEYGDEFDPDPRVDVETGHFIPGFKTYAISRFGLIFNPKNDKIIYDKDRYPKDENGNWYIILTKGKKRYRVNFNAIYAATFRPKDYNPKKHLVNFEDNVIDPETITLDTVSSEELKKNSQGSAAVVEI